MRIGITVDPYVPVPPRHYGGIERAADLAIRGLVQRGHTVTVFAHPDSLTAGTLVPYGHPPHRDRWSRLVELRQLGAELWRRRRDLDVVFSWGRLAALLPILPVRSLPKIQRYCRNEVPWRGVRRAVHLAGDSIWFAGASASVYDERAAQGPDGGRWRTIHDAIDPAIYTAVASVPDDAPLVFLGRLERVKGVHDAIAIARRARRRLVIAGNRAERGPEAEYFVRQVAPAIDGTQITYVGPVDDRQKNALLGRAAALLFPIAWKEAFGLVMAEAFACGTPVIGFASGSVPEIVRDGLNGFVCRDVSEAIDAVDRIRQIDRVTVRADCEARFGAATLVASIESLCTEAIEQTGAARHLVAACP